MNKILVYAFGETDLPDVMIVDTVAQAQTAVLLLVFGPGTVDKADAENLLYSWDSNEKVMLEVDFEIGGVKVEKVFFTDHHASDEQVVVKS